MTSHARLTVPQWGRFLSVDSHSGKPTSPQTWNRYAYALNNPLKYVDPDGKEAVVFVVGASNIIRDLSGAFGHTAIWVKAGDKSNGLSFGSPYGFRRNAGYESFISAYQREGRPVHAFVMKSSPAGDQQMLAAIQKKQWDSGTFNICTNNCSTSVTAILQAGGVIPMTQTQLMVGNSGSVEGRANFISPEGLEQALSSGGEFASAVQYDFVVQPKQSSIWGIFDPFAFQGALIDGVWVSFETAPQK